MPNMSYGLVSSPLLFLKPKWSSINICLKNTNILSRHLLVLPVQFLDILSLLRTHILSSVICIVWTTTGSWEALVVTSDSEAHTWDFCWRNAEWDTLPIRTTTLTVVELVENQPAMGSFCLDMSMMLSEAILIPGLFSYQTQWFSLEIILLT